MVKWKKHVAELKAEDKNNGSGIQELDQRVLKK